ncbi:hypothetical protein BDV38DRAFT_280227 [Aspergillus pseudotamarii]|uniref:Uncharacterized protein n=1 Tax=Aspergillus pseudotamarii TaxID=132259 RepID=A0A5N6T1R5_ASPPS|nr:uncharacterized protein BDV38DRAFT_280227 [Aspergillus pseudotamarii]KAE8140232.1 hypothetical protein BDV38DRAFT_280227 [Aspergillus pseudotamarii]
MSNKPFDNQRKKRKEKEKEKEKDKDADSFVGSFSVPADEEDWARLVLTAKLRGKTIHDITKMGSGSKIRKKQFVMCRALWGKRMTRADFVEFGLPKYGLHDYWARATETIVNSDEFSKYLVLIPQHHLIETLTETDPRWAGSFMEALELQRECGELQVGPQDDAPPATKLRRRASRALGSLFSSSQQRRVEDTPAHNDDNGNEALPIAEDENIVNAALLSFLRRVAALTREQQSRWTYKRVLFQSSFGKCSYRAYTDGALRTIRDRIYNALVEVKKGYRFKDLEKIQLQETAELVGWMISGNHLEVYLNGYKLMVSQNGMQIFLTFGKMDDGYRGYLVNKESAANCGSFMRMQTYGPWNVLLAPHMKQFGIIITCITLAVNHQASS